MNSSQIPNIDPKTMIGQNNNSAGGDLIINNNYSSPVSHISSAIETVLSGIYNIVINDELKYKKPDTQPYSIEEKIEFNELNFFQDQLDDFMLSYPQVVSQINAGSANDAYFRTKILRYISLKFNKIKSTKKTISNDELIVELNGEIENELKFMNAQLNGDEYSAIFYVIFYVFTECKIFKKPNKGKINDTK